MEKFILKSGKLLARWRSGINYFLEEKIDGNATNLILFLLALFIFIILAFSLFFGFSFITDNYLIFLILLVVLGLVMLWAAIFYESNKHLETDHHNFKVEAIKKKPVKV